MFRSATTLMRVARRIQTANTTPLTMPSRRFGGHEGGHHHGPLDTSYQSEYYARFKLPPIPKDGIHRRSTIDGNAYGPWHSNFDGYVSDFSDMVPVFERHSPQSIGPYKSLFQFSIAAVCLWGPFAFCHFVVGDEHVPRLIPASHPGYLPELISAPRSTARQLVVEMI